MSWFDGNSIGRADGTGGSAAVRVRAARIPLGTVFPSTS